GRRRGRPPAPTSESEKDSGFSDASSEYLSTLDQTDTEESAAQRLPKPPRPRRAPGFGCPFPSLAPIYIVKNVILKQPLGGSPGPQLLAWSHPPLDAAQSQARLLFLPQSMPTAALKPLRPGRKPPAKDTYLPILKAYPKIAPHPDRGRESKAGPALAPAAGTSSTSHSKTKCLCLEEASVPPVPDSSSQELAPSAGSPPAPLPRDVVTSSTESGGSLAAVDPAEGRMLSRASKKLGPSLGKQRRFHNTVEILRRSGLLGITLRTKELLRQNSSTQREIAELQEHARLLCQAVQGNDAQAWARLQDAISLSPAYGAKWGRVGLSRPAALGPDSTAAPTDSHREPPPSSPPGLALAPAPDMVPAPLP
ncbi:CLOCK-interacting pacemaker-like, partial [Alligator sinensis]|uniref:CLOCK-interacting pacemaker-like n=1 Tax=Alligator sinensis TaxID=38654 RepID=A0A1U8DEF8_ALLSI